MNFILMNETTKSRYATTLEKLLRGFEVELPPGTSKIEINGITDDSRKVNAGDLFVAVPGSKIDGRRFIGEASSLGAVAVLTVPGEDFEAGIPLILTSDIRNVTAGVADRFYESPTEKLRVAGITGTNGKTTVSYLLAGIFETAGEKWGRIGTTGYDLGGTMLPSGNTTPGPVDLQRFFATMVEKGLSGCAMEVSSHALDQGRCEAVRFASATFTNLSQDHLDYHKNMDSYFEAKALLFDKTPVAVVNIDNVFGRRLIERIKGDIITFGSNKKADLRYRALAFDVQGSTMAFEFGGRKTEFRFSLPGLFNHQNAAAAGATAIALGQSLEQVASGLTEAPAVPGRLQAVRRGQPFGVYVDYAHTPDALEKLLRSLREFKPRNLRLVFGCGGDRDRAKRPIMGEIALNLADMAYVTSDNPRSEEPSDIIQDILKGINDRKKCVVIEDRAEAIRAALREALEGDVVVIAGKGHEDYQIIGSVRKYFSDCDVAEAALSKLGYAGNDRK